MYSAAAIAQIILRGYERHYQLFQDISRSAKTRFEQAKWQEVQQASRERTRYYDMRVAETIDDLKQILCLDTFSSSNWKEVKSEYSTLIAQHPQAELAESFYNSVFCHSFERKYYNNDNIFVESTVNLQNISTSVPIFKSYFPAEQGICRTVARILVDIDLAIPFENLSRDVKYIIRAFRRQVPAYRRPLSELRLDIITSVFYRNKGAYIVGRVVSHTGEQPFLVPILNNEQGAVFADTLLTSPEQLAVVFGFARAYFFVETDRPSAIVSFLHRLIPRKTYAELYSSIGLHKQGKTQFYRDFLNHLAQSNDKLEIAPGVKGMVMAVFTLPSYPYVFKMIKDKFAPSKSVTPKIVKEKYQLVKLHDPVGRMADTMEYSDVAFPRERFSEELLTHLLEVCASTIDFDNDLVILRHCYIERRMTPLNIYLEDATEEQITNGIYGYGQAIKQLAAANIFPGDMLLKNFGVTRHGRVIFYDYDEISYMHEVNFRTIPKSQWPDDQYASEASYSVAPGDVFPEELATFVLTKPRLKEEFMKYHADLLEAKFWQDKQARLKEGVIETLYPYPDSIRFVNNEPTREVGMVKGEGLRVKEGS